MGVSAEERSTEEKLQVCRFNLLFFATKKCFVQQVTMATVLTPQVTRFQCLLNEQIKNGGFKKIDAYEANEM